MDNAILVVDDERDFLESLRGCLIISDSRNFRLVADPMEAVLLLERGENFDIVLLDITLPGMSGTEFLDRIKALSPRTQCIRVTAIGDLDTATQCLERGACDYLVKPFSGDELITRIQRALDREFRPSFPTGVGPEPNA